MNQPMAFKGFSGSAQSVNDEPDGFLEVMLGTAAESFVDTATFGIFQPDIISEDSEANSRIAATVGKVAGSLAGFMPSFGAANVAAKGIMGAFKFSTKIAMAAEKMQVAGQATGNAVKFTQAFKPLALKGLGDAVPTFILYDVSREFIRQTKEDDPDLEALGHAAIRGGVSGFFTGSVAAGFALESSMKQAIAMGSSMALAETINDASEGEDVLSSEYFTDRVLPNFAMGLALGAWGSRGVEARREAFGQDVVKRGKAFMAGEVESADALTGKKVFKDPHRAAEEYGIEVHKSLVKADPKHKAEYDLFFKKWNQSLMGKKDSERVGQNRLHAYKSAMKMKDEEYKSFLSQATGKDSTKNFTKDDYKIIETEIAQKAAKYKDAKTTLQEKFGGTRGAGIGESYIAPGDAIMTNTGMRELADPLIVSKMMANNEVEIVQPMLQKLFHNYEQGFGEGIKKGSHKSFAPQEAVPDVGLAPQAFGKVLNAFKGNRSVNDAMKDLSARLQMKDGGKGLTGKMKEAYDGFNQVTEFYLDRTNQVLRHLGKPEISKKDFYMRHIIDREALAKKGIKRSEMPQTIEEGGGKPIYLADDVTKFSADRVESVQMQRKSDLPYIQDPVRATMNMVRQDLKIIFLHEPIKILDSEMKVLRKAGIISKEAQDTIGKFLNQNIIEQPTKMTKVVNNQITRWLEEGKIGQVIDKFFLDSGHWLGDNPVGAFASLWGSGTSKAFLAVNPKMSMLNTLQFINTHGFVESKYIAKGMMGRESQPKFFQEQFEKSIMLGNTRGKMIEWQQGTGSSVEKSGFHAFQAGTNVALENTWFAAAHRTIDKLTNPNKVKEGWQDAAGIKLRSEMRSRIGTNAEKATDKNWNYTLSNHEKELFMKETDHITNSVNFLYNSIGATGVMRSAVTRPFFSLTSYPMNYFYKFLGEMYTRAKTGKPSWAKDTNISLPMTERLGIVKHLVGLGAITAILAKTTDLDYNKMSGTSIPFGIKEGGVMSFAPSPAMTLFNSIVGSFSNDPRTRAEAKGGLLRSLPVPYQGAVRQAARIVEGDKENTDLLFYRKYKKPKKTNMAFEGFKGF